MLAVMWVVLTEPAAASCAGLRPSGPNRQKPPEAVLGLEQLLKSLYGRSYIDRHAADYSPLVKIGPKVHVPVDHDDEAISGPNLQGVWDRHVRLSGKTACDPERSFAPELRNALARTVEARSPPPREGAGDPPG